MRAHHLSLLGLLACAGAAGAQVRPGIDVVLADSAHLIAHKRLGLLTNQTGVDAAGRRDVDVLIAEGYRVTALFSPEHGFRGLEDRRSEEHTSELQSPCNLVWRLLLEKKKIL